MFFITLLDQIYWVASAAMGAALGSVLPFSTEGVDFVMTAMFVVIFLNQWEKEKQHASAIIGIAAPLVCLRIFGSGSFLIPSMVCILAALLLFRRPIEPKKARRQNEQYPVHPDHRRLRSGDHAHPFSAFSGVRLPGRQGA